jgi:signal transduction histidine kinase/ActR/RegA family two-component response regulator
MASETPSHVAPDTLESRVIVLPSTRADGLAMAKVFGANGILFTVCANMAELCSAQRAGAGLLIVCEEAVLADGPELLRSVAEQPVWSDLPILVLSSSGRERAALTELLQRLGNVSVVERPIRTSTLLSLVRSGLRARARQHQVREYLAQQRRNQEIVHRSAESERAAREEAERASRTKDEFLATLSHELRTPLNAVLGWAHLLRNSPGLSHDAMNGLTVIERNARAQAQIIEDLLDMSSIISGKVRLDMRRLDLAAVINATVETIRPSAQAKGIALEMTLDPLAGPATGDPNRLQQVCWNLLANAVKFTPAGGRIKVALARVDSHLQIEVGDDGEGIDPAFLPHVFDRFRQADPSSTRRHGGLGLGLSICKQLIELHGGSIAAKSAGKGLGSTFRVMLPVTATFEDAHEPQVSREHTARATDLPALENALNRDLSGIKVLVVDDEADAGSLIQRLLQDCSATVTTASSAVEAIKMLMHEAPDVLISDIGMPAEDGYGLIRRVRALSERHATIPAIALTAYARMEDRAKAMQAGFQTHLSKPVDPGELVAMVQSLVRRPDAKD